MPGVMVTPRGVITTATGIATAPGCCCEESPCNCVGASPDFLSVRITGGPTATEWVRSYIEHIPTTAGGVWECWGQLIQRSVIRVYGNINGEFVLRRSTANPCCYRSVSWIFEIDNRDVDISTGGYTGFRTRVRYYLTAWYTGLVGGVELVASSAFDGADPPAISDAEMCFQREDAQSPTYPTAGPCNWSFTRDARGAIDDTLNPARATDYAPGLEGLPSVGTRIVVVCPTATQNAIYGDYVADPGLVPGHSTYPYDPAVPIEAQAGTPCGCLPNQGIGIHSFPNVPYAGLNFDVSPVVP